MHLEISIPLASLAQSYWRASTGYRDGWVSRVQMCSRYRLGNLTHADVMSSVC